MGLDVRLVLPGRCLLCFGGLAGLTAARDELLAGVAVPAPADFRAERLGSLRSLNALAVSLAQTLLEQCLAGRLTASTWLQGDVGDGGVPRLTYPAPVPTADCPLCALTASGDAGLHAFPAVLRRL
jgi:hypothetical protein